MTGIVDIPYTHMYSTMLIEFSFNFKLLVLSIDNYITSIYVYKLYKNYFPLKLFFINNY